MKIIRGYALEFVPASHEDPENPGSLKKVMIQRDDIAPGRLQMVNWSLLPKGTSFRSHYHEDMTEVFVVMEGTAQISAGGARDTLSRGDAVIIEAREVHEMTNSGEEDLQYLAFGIASGTGGKTVLAQPFKRVQ